jgi:hypothetical protein
VSIVAIILIRAPGTKIRQCAKKMHAGKLKKPLQIAKVMGHRNAEMIINVYAKYIDDVVGIDD